MQQQMQQGGGEEGEAALKVEPGGAGDAWGDAGDAWGDDSPQGHKRSRGQH